MPIDRRHIHPALLSGGSGTRLWPMSRSLFPKQLLNLTSDRSMLQETALRMPGGAGYAPPLVICNQEHRFTIAEQMRALGTEPAAIVLEPVGRNTAPAATVAALMTQARDPDGIVVLLPADGAIRDVEAFRAAVDIAAEVAADDLLVTFGVRPHEAHTGYGYICRGDALEGRDGAFRVARFVEKPDRATAEGYLADGRYLWNSGIFAYRAGTFLAEIERLQPDMLAACREAVAAAEKDLDFTRLEPEAFKRSPSDSIDYAVMEHTARAAVVPVDFGWSDVGSWDALWALGDKDDAGNHLEGDVIIQDVRNSYIRSEKSMVAAIGLDNIVIVETPDALLVADRRQSQAVKEIVDRLKASGREEHASHVRHYRPWGFYETIDAGDRFQVKHLMVKPGGRLSLQMHHHRAEHWIVVKGTARVTRGEEEMLLSENQSTYISIGMTHRLENPGRLPLELIEVQSGSYLGEDDIVRLEDVYNRTPDETR
ncbi:mannose-1-phosphate guanylyltransferase/mannose-6-phosphate isomerase [Oceanibacterium hippocampi]|uniref:mannose-1-phosphate guanylyltransferase n=1 Tax=Oceanibacterium hippocampi TaxID=745714 RepID=A0A1Y5TPG1_9PROT|nr:mannose-1-phosphate guanylyltransferase/mannose-6-phosphate isomerase [Oceanibacterium hippocampi]SLN68921.1 Mannose-1-phosphate guanylyltransferase 1 [Oceanibacterium hippocampi]